MNIFRYMWTTMMMMVICVYECYMRIKCIFTLTANSSKKTSHTKNAVFFRCIQHICREANIFWAYLGFYFSLTRSSSLISVFCLQMVFIIFICFKRSSMHWILFAFERMVFVFPSAWEMVVVFHYQIQCHILLHMEIAFFSQRPHQRCGSHDMRAEKIKKLLLLLKHLIKNSQNHWMIFRTHA